jgi:hypothetical protein
MEFSGDGAYPYYAGLLVFGIVMSVWSSLLSQVANCPRRQLISVIVAGVVATAALFLGAPIGLVAGLPYLAAGTSAYILYGRHIVMWGGLDHGRRILDA